jgi:hypothetical protein
LRANAAARSPRVAHAAVSDRTRWGGRIASSFRIAALRVVASLAVIAALAAALRADPLAPGSGLERVHVVWVRDDRIYLVAAHALPLEVGARVEITRGGAGFATAEVTAMLTAECALARRTAGTLDSTSAAGAVSVRHAPLRRLDRMRIGFPGPRRAVPRAACPPRDLVPPAGFTRAADLDTRTLRWVRDTTWRDTVAALPDTLLLRAFADAADQEIALERGEIDVAIFLPGELSERMQRHPDWRGFPVAVETSDSASTPGHPTAADSARAAQPVVAMGSPVLSTPLARTHVRVLGAATLASWVRCPRVREGSR